MIRKFTIEAHDPVADEAARTAASTCQCDVLVTADGRGTMRVVRTKPAPPKVQTVSGRAGVVDLIAGPPAARVVRFEGVDADSVEYFAQSVALVNRAAPEVGGFRRLVNSISGAFGRERNAVGATRELVVWTKERPETVHLVDNADSIAADLSAATKVDGSVTTVAGDAKDWAARVGLPVPRPADVTPVAVIVKFGSGGKSATLEPIGVYAEFKGPAASAGPAALRQVAQNELAQLQGKDVPIVDGVSSLAESIRRQLQPEELHFFRRTGLSGTLTTQVIEAAPPIGAQ